MDSGATYTATILDADGTPLTRRLDLGELEPGRERTWNHTLRNPIVLKGTIRGIPNPAPLASVAVFLEKIEDAPGFFAPPRRTLTDEEGNYEFRILSGPGTYRISPRYKRDGSFQHPAPEESFEVEARAGAEKRIDLRLPTPWTRSFRVIDIDGTPVPGTAIEVRERLDKGERVWRWNESTDSEGYVRLDGLSPDAEIVCRFFSEGARGDSESITGIPGGEFGAETVVLYPESGVAGFLTDHAGDPLGNRRFELTVLYGDGLERRLHSATDTLGAFEFANELPAVTAVCRIEAALSQNEMPLVYESAPIQFVQDQIADLGSLEPLEAVQ